MRFKNKVLLVLSIFCLIILLIPIIVFANSQLQIIIPITLEDTEEVTNSKLMDEKNQFKATAENDSIYESKISTDNELNLQLEELEKNNSNTEKEIENIINKYHKEEYLSISQENSINSNKIQNNSTLSNSEIKFYDLLLDIINTKELTPSERSTLKDFMKDQYPNVIKNDKLKNEFTKVLNK